MDRDFLEESVERLAVNFNKMFTKLQKRAYQDLLYNKFSYVDNNEWADAVEIYIGNPENKHMPKIGNLLMLLPAEPKDTREARACNKCSAGYYSVIEKYGNEQCYSIPYACDCEKGLQFIERGLFAPYLCKDCIALDEGYCNALEFEPYEVKCLKWKRRLSERGGGEEQNAFKAGRDSPLA